MIPGRTPTGLFFGLAVPLLFITLQVCVPLNARPESDLNPLDSVHQVIADIEAEGDSEWLAFFWVDFGPNAGENSLSDCNLEDLACDEEIIDTLIDCVLSSQSFEEFLECLEETIGDECIPNCLGSGDETVTWSYTGEGGPGTDYIIVCAFDLAIVDSGEEVLSGLQVGATQFVFPEEPSEEEIEAFESATDCDVVTKTWEEEEEECAFEADELDELDRDELEDRADEAGLTDEDFEELCDVEFDEADDDDERVTNPGGVFAGDVGAAQRNRDRARASVAVAATPRPAEASVRPPSTGDAGLHD